MISTVMGSSEDAKNVTLLRVLTDLQALLAAQRRIEWKLTGLEKAQHSVNDTLKSFRQDIVEMRGRIDTFGQEKSKPQTHPSDSPVDGTPSATAVVTALTATASPKKRAQLDVELSPVSMKESPNRSSPSTRSVKSVAQHQEEVLRLFRNDGRILTQLGRWKKNKTTTACKLPAIDVRPGQEIVGQAIERMVTGRLGVLSRGIVLTGESEEVIPTARSRRFSITGAMSAAAGPKKSNQLIFEGLMDPSFRIPSVCVASVAGSFRPTKVRAMNVPKEDILAIWWEGDVFLYSWLTSEELEFFASDGDSQLGQWIATSVVNEQSLQKVVSI